MYLIKMIESNTAAKQVVTIIKGKQIDLSGGLLPSILIDELFSYLRVKRVKYLQLGNFSMDN